MTTMKKSIHDNANGLHPCQRPLSAEPDRSSPGRAPHRAVGPLT